jgi:hypothetical protein
MRTQRLIWLENAIETFITNNPKVDSIDIVAHFRLKADTTLDSLAELVKQNRVKRVEVGASYRYVKNVPLS